jgi:hypothetical protein
MKNLLIPFLDSTLQHFCFLEKKYKITHEQISPSTIRWSKKNYCLEISYDYHYSYEINLFFYDTNSDTPPFELYDLIKLAGIEYTHMSAFQASSEERITQLVEKISNKLNHVMQNLSVFSSDTIDKLIEQRKQDCKKNTTRGKLFRIRKDAEIAWKKREYTVLVELYGPFLDALSPSELKKYEYAIKKLND